MPVLAKATGFDCPYQALQLYFQLRSMFSRVICFLARKNPSWSFSQRQRKDASPSNAKPTPIVNLVEALGLIVQSDILTPGTKLLLIDKVHEIVLSNPRIIIGNILLSALGNVIPLHHTISHEDIVPDHLELQHIVTILERPGMLVQLAKIPSAQSNSLHSVLCSKIPNPLSKDDVVEIYECIASLKDENKEFFYHLLPLLESITKMCSSVSEIRDLLIEAETILRQIPPELIPLSVLIFSHLVESKVTKDHRAAFIKLVALKWEIPCHLDVYTYYEIPQLLWKAHQSASGAGGKSEIIDHIHEVIVRSKDLEAHVLKGQNSKMNCVQRSIACRDLEWLTLHSSLTCEDVALCFHLSSCYPGVRALKCFNLVSGVQIQDGCITPIPFQQNDARKLSDDKSPSRVKDGAQDSFDERATPSEKLPSLLTPAAIAHKLIVELRRLLGDDINLRDIAVQLWNSLFNNLCPRCPDDVCKSSNCLSTCDEFVSAFLSVLEKAPYLEVVHPWFSNNKSQHHVIQCSKVILESCGWNGENVDKEGHLRIQAEVIVTLEVLRSVSNVPMLPLSCFRLFQPQLECLLCILQKRLPFEVTASLLKLARIDWKAAAAITAIASLWDFVWDMLEACGRVYEDSSKDLLYRLDCLINLQNPDEADYGLYRLPMWRKMMTAEGFPAHVIDKWCVAFLFTPRENLSSRDVDAVLDLSPSSLQLIAPVLQSIKQCLFPEDFQVTEGEGIKDHLIKERLRLARLLGEFVNILKLRKSKEAPSDAAVTNIVVDACEELCKSYLDKNTSKNLYKIHRRKLKDLFAKVFGKHSTSDDERVSLQECGRASNKEENESRVTVPEPYDGESRMAVPEAHENKPRAEVPEVHEDKSRVAETEAHEKESRLAVSEAHEKESRIAVPEAHENESRVAVPETHQDESRVTVPGAHENESRIAVPEIHENEARVAVPEAHENKSRVAVREAHENNPREEVPKVHEDESRLAETEAHEKESRIAVPEAHEKESRIAVSEAHENESNVLKRVEVYELMLVLLRRWLSSITNKPALASLTLEIVQLLLSEHSTKKGSSLLDELHHKIQPHILYFPANQILISQLQAAGYNQTDPTDNQDLWASSSVELSCYLSQRESLGEKTLEKKLTNVLRRHWMEWKNLLFMLNIAEIEVSETKVRTKDLFGFQACLKEMENQVAAVKERVSQVHSEDVDRRVKQLIRQEQRHRYRINELYKSSNAGVGTTEGKNGKEKKKFTKFVAVWENQFLGNVKLCSERIPGCYAPNGFHSEKPVICALSVDNRILTIFKEEKPGRREEIENVEVKLFEAGLYVYGLHPSGHDYVTDELWAAFYKMLLEKGLVPSIVLSNESPGFDWIKNSKFVQPAKTHPCTWKWELHRGIVPPQEDYFDYLPVHAALWPFLHGHREYLTLTRESVARFHFSDFKDAKVVEKKQQKAKAIAGSLKANRQLQRELHSLHGDEELIETLAGKLASAVNGTVHSIVNGEQPTTESVKKLIDMKRLAFVKCKKACKSNVKKCDCKFNEALKGAENYAAVVLRVCAGVQEAFCDT
ncbi:hypothetical protein ACROYT_G042059 [Oculina patagonica]